MQMRRVLQGNLQDQPNSVMRHVEVQVNNFIFVI